MTEQSLTTTEQSRLELLEGEIEDGLASFIKVGNALSEIDETKLYRGKYGTFEQYCEQRWKFSRQRGYQLIAASKMSTIVDIQHESWARPLAELETVEDKQVAVYLAKKTAPGGKVTAAHLKSTVKVVNDILASKGHVDTGNGTMTALQAAIDIETQERLKRQQQHIQERSEWEWVAVAEFPAQPLLGIEQLAESLADVDEAEIVKVIVYKKKVDGG